MARHKNDGKGRMGGRTKGTPNKVTSSLREWITAVIQKNRKCIERDLKQIDPKDRLIMLEKLMQYVLPKQQAVKADVSLESMSDEQLDKLVCMITEGIDDADES